MIEKLASTLTTGKTLDANLINMTIPVKCVPTGIPRAPSVFTRMDALADSNATKVMAGTRANIIQTPLKLNFALKRNHLSRIVASGSIAIITIMRTTASIPLTKPHSENFQSAALLLSIQTIGSNVEKVNRATIIWNLFYGTTDYRIQKLIKKTLPQVKCRTQVQIFFQWGQSHSYLFLCHKITHQVAKVWSTMVELHLTPKKIQVLTPELMKLIEGHLILLMNQIQVLAPQSRL